MELTIRGVGVILGFGFGSGFEDIFKGYCIVDELRDRVHPVSQMPKPISNLERLYYHFDL